MKGSTKNTGTEELNSMLEISTIGLRLRSIKRRVRHGKDSSIMMQICMILTKKKIGKRKIAIVR